MHSNSRLRALLVSSDHELTEQVRTHLESFSSEFEHVPSEAAAIELLGSPRNDRSATGLMFLDARLPAVANGHLLAAIHELGIRRRWAMALIVDQVSDDWIARLREGVVDVIVPRDSNNEAWKIHVNTMQRGHSLLCELEQIREASPIEVKHDPVTGTLNRETMLTVLFRETDRVQRLQGILSAILFSVDDFDRLKDIIGRDGADQLIREVARRASRMLRTYDALGRQGSDEFLLALPGCSVINAMMIAERMRIEVFGEPFWVRNSRLETLELRVSACFGIATSRGRSPMVLIREAEQALRHAQELGPDTMHGANESSTASGPVLLFPDSERATL